MYQIAFVWVMTSLLWSQQFPPTLTAWYINTGMAGK